ncbi:MAG: T9SS type B sorting domain-containing protein [Chloroflexia bacterium]|nr:T9SS type B sorting domain-containing protein [Chloroflexia bacterium]
MSIGENEVELTVVDKAGNTDTERAIVTVIDTLPPVFEYYPDIYVLADKDESTVIVNYNDPVAWDNCSAEVVQIAGLPSGEAFSAGPNLISYRATDPSGNSSEMSFLIYVIPYSELALRVPEFKYCFNSVDSLRLPGKVLEMNAEWFYDREITEPIELSESNKMEAPQTSTTIYALLKGFYNVPKVIVPISVTVYSLPKIDAGEDVTIFQGTKLQLNATYDTTYTYLWTVSDSSETTSVNDLLDDATITKLLLSNDTIYNPIFDGKVIDKYELRVQVTDAHFCINADTLIVEVGGLKPYTGFTPNDDGFNDYWVVKNIELYPDNFVKIFDRNNVLVYQKRSYDNSWEGTYTKTGQKLPSGTYFYIIELSGGAQVYKGVVTILTND